MNSSIVITAADSKFFDLVKGTILSIREKPQGKSVDIGFFDLGCTREQLEWISSQVNHIVEPSWDYVFPEIDSAPSYLRGLLARPFLARYFPKYQIYIWIDADAWVQDWFAIDLLIQGSKKRGLAIIPEIDRGNKLLYDPKKYYLAHYAQLYKSYFPDLDIGLLPTYPMLNAGVFALHHEAPHWQAWNFRLAQALQREHSIITDQIALNVSVYVDGLIEQTEFLPAYCNWTCHYGLPKWDMKRNLFVEPYLPYTPIAILHLTGDIKKYQVGILQTTEDERIELSLRFPLDEANRIRAKHDYISPGFHGISLDHCFPNLRVGNVNECPWPYLRKEIPHLWYVDQRNPAIGFVSRDEAHILYNTALKFKGQPALEIGCWMGWSAAHIASGGVMLDVVDPILDVLQAYESVDQSLTLSGIRSNVTLYPGTSPEKVEEIAKTQNRRWSLIFIDGDHEHLGPLRDAQTTEKYCAEDALILFHDLVSPAVAKGLHYFRDQGWNTMIYQTMQIMGVAWRGQVQPVEHIPDMAVQWTLPHHLDGYRISGFASKESIPSVLTEHQVTQRPWKTGLPLDTMKSIQQGSLAYNYKGIPTIKNPFDLALYPLLLWQVRPKTIIEIGSYRGGSALWLGDLSINFGLDTHIYSIDLNQVTDITHPRVTYLGGSGRELEAVLDPSFLSRLPRPLLLIEDADHKYETTIKVLEFFHQYLLPNEYIIVEDGIVSDMGEDVKYNGGPNRATKEFLSRYSQDYLIDSNYCDFFGQNFTWCINGYLKRTGASLLKLDSNFHSVFETIQPFTMLGLARLSNLYSLAKKICQEDIPGNFVECGVYKGGSSALLAWVVRHFSRRPRKVYCFDTFSGMPNPTEVDRNQGIPANDTGFGAGTLVAPIAENLKQVCESLGVWEWVIPVAGLFENTLPAYREEVGEVALLHADGDWYNSTKDILQNLYSRVNLKGFIQINDYGHWEGCKKAIHEFEQEIGAFFRLHTIDYTGAWLTPAENLTILSTTSPETSLSGIHLSHVNLALFPNWETNSDTLVAELEPLLEYILLSQNPRDYALIISTELDYCLAESVLEMTGTNVVLKLMEQGHELIVEPWVSLIQYLNAEQWERLLPQLTHHYYLVHERTPARIQTALSKLPRFELPPLKVLEE